MCVCVCVANIEKNIPQKKRSVASGKARSILGLVLPQGPSLVDPLAAASVEDLEAHTVTWMIW